MRIVPGTAEVNSWGGLEKQYQVRIDPGAAVQARHLTFEQVMQAVRANNLNVGGGNIDRAGDMLLVHGIGRTVNRRADREHRDHAPRTACRFASATWPKSPSATKSAAAR